MPEPRNYQTEAIVIKKTKLGEADSILTLYTPHLGKIQGFAKSLRKPKSKLAGHLELITHSLVSLARGRNLDTITGSQTINSFIPLKNDLWLTSCALYVTEMVNQFAVEQQENFSLFQLTIETLNQLCQANNKELVLRHFEMHLLDSAGYRPQLRECVACHLALEPTTNSFSPGAGGLLCPNCSLSQSFAYPLSVNAQKVLRLLQSSDFSSTSRLKIEPELAREIERVMSSYLKYLLEKEVRSAAWLETLREQRLKLNRTALP
jgi:DNA repair protein RecO (recombination protein O)